MTIIILIIIIIMMMVMMMLVMVSMVVMMLMVLMTFIVVISIVYRNDLLQSCKQQPLQASLNTVLNLNLCMLPRPMYTTIIMATVGFIPL